MLGVIQWAVTGIGSLLLSLWLSLCSIVTGLIYNFMEMTYKLFYDISNTTILRDTVGAFGRNMYAILGVIMLFKLAFSIINYIVNPDQFSNKETGFGGMIKNVFIVILLIITVPIIFEQAMNLQYIILKEDVVGRIVTGQSKSNTNQKASVGQRMAFSFLQGFVRPNNENGDLPACEDILSMSYQEFSGPGGCLEQIRTKNSSAATKYDKALRSENWGALIGPGLLIEQMTSNTGDQILVFEYDVLTAQLVGGFVGYIFMLFCLDVAVRSVKLTFLEIISPIPIISYIDPKSKKQIFDKWVSVCVKTYLDLFLRLAAIYFAVFLIQCILQGGDGSLFAGIATVKDFDVSTGTVVYKKTKNLFVIYFMICGVLLFAKQMPKLIEEITGIKLDGKFQLGMANKLGQVPLIGGLSASAWTKGKHGLAAGAGWLTGGALQKSTNPFLSKMGNKMKTNSSKRWNRAKEEAEARRQASGLAGGEYKGDTVEKMAGKERAENRKKAREGYQAVNEQRRLYFDGKDASDRLSTAYGNRKILSYDEWVGQGWTDANGKVKDDRRQDVINAYRAAGYTDDQYINSLIQKEELGQAYKVARQNYSDKTEEANRKRYEIQEAQKAAIADGRDPDSDAAVIALTGQLTSLTNELVELQDKVDKASKNVESNSKMHENIRAQNESDRHLEDALKAFHNDEDRSGATPQNTTIYQTVNNMIQGTGGDVLPQLGKIVQDWQTKGTRFDSFNGDANDHR